MDRLRCCQTCAAPKAASIASDEPDDYNDISDQTPPESALTHGHSPPRRASLASVPPLSSQVIQKPVALSPRTARTPPTAQLPAHGSEIFEMRELGKGLKPLHGGSSPVTQLRSTLSTLRVGAAEPGPKLEPEPEPKPEPKPLTAHEQATLLAREPWFHGVMSRFTAEKLVRADGEFLVRISNLRTGQYVLTVMRGKHRHLLFVDYPGVVQTKDNVFQSVAHLVNFHYLHSTPLIVSMGAALWLRAPVLRTPRPPSRARPARAAARRRRIRFAPETINYFY